MISPTCSQRHISSKLATAHITNATATVIQKLWRLELSASAQSSTSPKQNALTWQIICTVRYTFHRATETLTFNGSRPTLRTLVKLNAWPACGISMRMGRTPVAIALACAGAEAGCGAATPAVGVVKKSRGAAVGAGTGAAEGAGGGLAATVLAENVAVATPDAFADITARGTAASRCKACSNFSWFKTWTLPSAKTTARPFTSEAE